MALTVPLHITSTTLSRNKILAIKKNKKQGKKRGRRQKAADVLRQVANTVMGARDIGNPQKKVWMIVPFLVSGTFNIIANMIEPKQVDNQK